MRGVYAVAGVYFRQTGRRLLPLLCAISLIQTALFWRVLDPAMTLEGNLQEARLGLVGTVGFVLLCAILSLPGCEKAGSRLRYTLQRLPVPETAAVLLWALCAVMCLLLYWAAQALTCLALCLWYTRQNGPLVHDMTVFLAFYRCGYLHALLPLADGCLLLRNLFLLPALGISAAMFHLQQRRGRPGLAALFLTAVTAAFFARTPGGFTGNLLMTALAVAVLAYELYLLLYVQVWKEEPRWNESPDGLPRG